MKIRITTREMILISLLTNSEVFLSIYLFISSYIWYFLSLTFFRQKSIFSDFTTFTNHNMNKFNFKKIVFMFINVEATLLFLIKQQKSESVLMLL